MAISGKYGQLDIPPIGSDEPVFILRAQDLLALTAIRMYQLLLETHGCLGAEDLDGEVRHFRDWPGCKKMPD